MRAGIALVVAVGAVACGDTEFSTSAPDGGEVTLGDLPRPGAGVVTSTDPVTTDPAGTVDRPVVDATTVPTTSDTPTVTTTASVEGAVVLGDGLCAAWSQLSTSMSVLDVAATSGDLSDRQLARLEVIASPLLRRALDDVAIGLDDAAASARSAADADALARERDLVLVERFGRVDARVAAALAALDELVTSDGAIALLAQVWLDGLVSLDPDRSVPQLADLGPELGPIVDAAASAFAADAPRWDTDAALAPAIDPTAVPTPTIDALLARDCPASLASSDG